MATTSHFPNIFDLDQLVILTLFVLEPGEIAIPGSRARCFGAIGAIWLPPRYQYFTRILPRLFPGAGCRITAREQVGENQENQGFFEHCRPTKLRVLTSLSALQPLD